MDNNWKFKTLRNLEKTPKFDSSQQSYLFRRCNELLDQPLNEFSVEDLRIMIGQQFSLDYLVPLAVEQLTIDILVEGDFYPGDLLISLLKIDEGFWHVNKQLLNELTSLIIRNKSLLYTADVSDDLFERFLKQ